MRDLMDNIERLFSCTLHIYSFTAFPEIHLKFGRSGLFIVTNEVQRAPMISFAIDCFLDKIQFVCLNQQRKYSGRA